MDNKGHRTAGAKVGTGTLDADANRDPLTGETGAHPVGTGVGAATGGTVGAVIGGAVGGPLGAMVGAAVGGLTGGLAGRGIAEAINPTEEDTFWRGAYRARPYAQGRSYEDLQPAYRYGWESRARYPDRSWEQVEGDLERDWERSQGSSGLAWHEAKDAVRDAWSRVTDRFGRDSNYARAGRSEIGGGLGSSATSGMTGGSMGATTVATGATISQGITGGSYLTHQGATASGSSQGSTGYGYEDYRPAYWYGWEAVQKYSGRRWDDIATELERSWHQTRGASRLSWKEAEPAVREAWNQAISLQARPKAAPLAVDLQELHDPETGRLDAARVAEYLKLPLKQLSEALGRNYSTVHRTPAAPAIQETLRSIKRSLEILGEVLGDRARMLAWWNSPHPDLGRKTPMQVLLEGRAQAIEDMLEAALEGIPS